MTQIAVLSEKEEDFVREAVDALLAERFRRADAAVLEEMPGVKQVSGPEELAFNRTTEQGYWDQLTATYPGLAKYRALRWMALERKYG